MEAILLAVIVGAVVVVAIKLFARDPDLENLTADQMAHQVKLLQKWIKRYHSLQNPPDDLKRLYVYKQQRLYNALAIRGRKIKEVHSQESTAAARQESHPEPAEQKESDDVEAKLEQELNELEAGIRQADLLNMALIGTTLEMLQKGFSDRHGSFEEFSKKGGNLAEYVNLLMHMAQDYSAQDNPHGEWASRLCAVHASAAYLEKHKLEARAKAKIDEVISKAAQFDDRARS